jgi:hypothetical protein
VKDTRLLKLLQIFFQIFVDPAKAFLEAFKLRPITAIFPLVVVVIGTALLDAYYYYHVDAAWLADLLTEKMPAAQKKLVQGALTPSHLLIISIVSVAILPASVDACRALFFWVALKIIGHSTSYISLFQIVTWAAVPLTLVLPAGIFALALTGAAHVAPVNVNPVSLNRLFFHYPPSSGWSQFFATLTLVGFWEIGLHAIGLKARTAIAMRTAALLAVAPVVLVYGVWGLFLLAGSGK